MNFVRRRIVGLLGALAVFWAVAGKLIKSILQYFGNFDLIISRVEEPSWIGTLGHLALEGFLNPPSWLLIPIVIVGLLLIWWDRKEPHKTILRGINMFFQYIQPIHLVAAGLIISLLGIAWWALQPSPPKMYVREKETRQAATRAMYNFISVDVARLRNQAQELTDFITIGQKQQSMNGKILNSKIRALKEASVQTHDQLLKLVHDPAYDDGRELPRPVPQWPPEEPYPALIFDPDGSMQQFERFKDQDNFSPFDFTFGPPFAFLQGLTDFMDREKKRLKERDYELARIPTRGFP
jgi:hypothetical protein